MDRIDRRRGITNGQVIQLIKKHFNKAEELFCFALIAGVIRRQAGYSTTQGSKVLIVEAVYMSHRIAIGGPEVEGKVAFLIKQKQLLNDTWTFG